MMRIVQLILISFIILTIGCKDTTKMSQESSPIHVDKNPEINALYYNYSQNPENQDQLDENAIIDYVVDHDMDPKRSITGLYYQIDQVGSGSSIRIGDKLSVHYIGKFLDGTEFDNSYKKDKPIEFPLGKGLIQGWIEGLRYLNEGAKATLLVPSRLGYEDRGLKDVIKPNTPLVFEVEILKVN